MAIEVFKIVTKNCPVYLKDIIKIKNTAFSFRYHNKAEIPRVRTNRYGINSLHYAGARLCNELPDHYRQDMSLNQFKNLINQWTGSSCHCGMQIYVASCCFCFAFILVLIYFWFSAS